VNVAHWRRYDQCNREANRPRFRGHHPRRGHRRFAGSTGSRRGSGPSRCRSGRIALGCRNKVCFTVSSRRISSEAIQIATRSSRNFRGNQVVHVKGSDQSSK
jgi:hypothetical protein